MENINKTIVEEDPFLKRDQNNFNLLRLLAACGVIITHSYALIGFAERDLLSKATNGLLSFSRLGVYVFFVISGFLVTQSLWNSQNIKTFLWKRFLRIFPALFVVLFLTTFIIGPLVTTSSIKSYLTQPGTYHYFLGGLSLYDTQYELLGVFKSNPRSGVNGSLWTLPYEWTCYILLIFLLLPFKKLKNKAFVPLAIVIILMILRLLVGRYQVVQVIDFLKLDSRQLLLFASLFFMGAFCLEIKKHIRYKTLVVIALAVLFAFLSYTDRNKTFYLILLVVPYITISLASLPLPQKINALFTKTDYSYGMYIYAFPVSQVLVNYFGKSLSVVSLALLTIALTLPLAVLSWHLIEKPCLKLKSFSFKKLESK